MVEIQLKSGADFEGFRQAVRSLLANGTAPESVVWGTCDARERFNVAPENSATRISLSADVVSLAKLVVCHTDPERYGLLYDLIWRVKHGEQHLLDVACDPTVHRLERMRKAIARDIHKMHAFVRFQNMPGDDGERFVAWFEPQFFILHEASSFFVSRFPSFAWSILTPLGSLHWDRHQLTAGGPASKSDLKAPEDEFEKGWIEYYRSTFNPARLNTKLMRAEMPKRYWQNLPEASAMGDMVRAAARRVDDMLEAPPSISMKRSPERALLRSTGSPPLSLEALNEIITASDAFVPGGTRAVLGEGPLRPDLAFIGEQPGDQEDIQGRPFVGPAGAIFDRALAASGISRAECYITNAVKHFKYEQRGKRRIHQTPTHGEIKHYRWWLQEELKIVQPKLVVALGASAAFALAGHPVKVFESRGLSKFGATPAVLTIHPSYILRLQDKTQAESEFAKFVADLNLARTCLAEAA